MIADPLNRAGSARVVLPIAMGRGKTDMSQISRGILGAIAISLGLGVASFAAGHDLVGNPVDVAGTPASDINRAAKADRAAGLKTQVVPMRTISLRVDGLSGTSVLIRIPVAAADRTGSSPRSRAVPAKGGTAVACEPVVSVLTEVAKQLQPGRCVT